MRNKKINTILNILLPILTILVIFLIWFFASIIVADEIVLASPFDAIKEGFILFGQGGFWKSLAGTLMRSAIAFVSSFVIAMLLAIISRINKNCKGVIKIIISILRALPTIAIILLLLLWTTSKVAAVTVTMLVVLPTTYNSIVMAFNGLESDVFEMLNIYKVPKKQQFLKYTLPQTTPSIIDTIGSGWSLNIKLIVASEVIAGTAVSIGQLMNESKIYFETARLFALVMITIIISVAIELIFSKVANIYRGRNGFRKS